MIVLLFAHRASKLWYEGACCRGQITFCSSLIIQINQVFSPLRQRCINSSLFQTPKIFCSGICLVMKCLYIWFLFEVVYWVICFFLGQIFFPSITYWHYILCCCSALLHCILSWISQKLRSIIKLTTYLHIPLSITQWNVCGCALSSSKVHL